MRKGRQNRANHLGPIKRDVPETFFRLCHHCLFLNESDSEVIQCSRCDKEFSLKDALSQYGFLPVDGDFEEDGELFDEQDEEEFEERKPLGKKPCLNGLNVKW